ncbi:YD repeat-containing protein [Maribacter caenipelagi]|uniref:YD repeat-containing protein n=1 Tax=Maribacter caenipelagi TaxID=1447781 RepID=A0A4V3E3H5_9FLAO|nr:hypothetical protein [Maribacter caenipelagi]TDS20878.1 YD repeat-containing protein [Maribacter caenipelagi]
MLSFKKYKIISQLSMCLFITMAYGQELPEVIPPSPETAALFKYQEYPMDYSTGLPQISIPLFEVKSGELSIPISISYHASGCKISDVDGPIATGWSLHAGGSISRTIHGSSDFGNGSNENFPFPSPFVTTDFNANFDDLAYAESIMQYSGNPDLTNISDFLDSEYDIFSYTINGQGGKFIFKDSLNYKKPVLIPSKPIRINPIVVSDRLAGLKVLDEKGKEFNYGASETNSTQKGVTTAYNIRTIISADKTDTINFDYYGDIQQKKSFDENIILTDAIFPTPNLSPNYYKNTVAVNNTSFYQISRLSRISFKNGFAIFNLIENATGNETNVENIEIFSNEDITKPLKTIRFYRSPLHNKFNQTVVTHKLDSIIIEDKLNKAVEKYAFEHYPTPGSNNESNFYINPRYKDWWGYYNASDVYDLIPEQEVSTIIPYNVGYTVGSSNTNREPNLNAMMSGVIKKIIYPTGGSSEFVYEHNIYKSREDNLLKKGPGLRLAKLITNDLIGNKEVNEFEYGLNNQKYGYLDLEPLPQYFRSEKLIIDFLDGGPNYYNVTHKRETIFHSSFVPQLNELSSRPVQYLNVTKYHGTKNENIGKTEFIYKRNLWGVRPVGPGLWDIPSFDYLNAPEIDSELVYKREGLSNYIVTKSKHYNYSTIEIEKVKGLHMQRRVSALGGRVISSGLYPESHLAENKQINSNAPSLNFRQIYLYREYEIPIGSHNLSNVQETLYDESGMPTIVSNTSYKYNSHQLIEQITTSSSEDDNIDYIEEITYPFDYPATGVFSQMINSNLLDFPIEKINFKGDRNLGTIKTDYSIWGLANPMIKPLSIASKKGTGSFIPGIEFKAYTLDGNIKEVTKANGPSIFYVWGYNEEYPIAKLENLDASKITPTIQNLIDEATSKSNLDDDRTKGFIGKEGELRQALVNLRNALPDNVFMSSYTYDTLIGITSNTDARGTVSYFEYDDFGRLINVKDLNEDKIKDIKYNYANGGN